MKKKPVFVAVSNQKGGVGKSTMLVALAMPEPSMEDGEENGTE